LHDASKYVLLCCVTDQPWAPECTEDELLLAFVAVKRGMLARDRGLDPGTFPALHQLAAFGPSRQGAIADALGVDASTVSRQVRALADAGLVESCRDPDDGRATLLSVTDAGRAHLVEHLRARRETLRAATADFTDHERHELVRLLHKLAAALAAPKEST
jgi:DNA-binding MarR family transcriptional regulator